jgi:glycosyltransferase involved in cell wall biosynthesis
MTTLALVSDAWHPQVNGVVRTLDTTRTELEKLGVTVRMITPEHYSTVPMPTYPEIRLAVTWPHRIHRELDEAQPDFVHIATEGPLGMVARRWCKKKNFGYTTSYHTRFPEYVRARMPVPLSWSYRFVRSFHNAGIGCMISNTTLERELSERGFSNLMRWIRGVDTVAFNPDVPPALPDLPRPVFIYVGRVAVEKNISAFLDLDLPGTKLVVGDGPERASLERRYSDAVFVGSKSGRELTAHYTSADVFVFPSLTDTWGLVQMEALACGVPVAAFPAMGPVDVIGHSGTGVIDDDLGRAAREALAIPRDRCREYALGFSWEASARQFLENLHIANDTKQAKAAA